MMTQMILKWKSGQSIRQRLCTAKQWASSHVKKVQAIEREGIWRWTGNVCCGALLSQACLLGGMRPFCIAWMAAALLWEKMPWGVGIGCLIGMILPGVSFSWTLIWQLMACSLLLGGRFLLPYFSIAPVWTMTGLAGMVAILPAPFLFPYPVQLVQCVLGALATAALVPAYDRIWSMVQESKPLSGWDDRICCLLGLATLVLGGMRWVVFEQSLGGVLAVLWVMVSAWAGGMTMAIPVGSAMGLTLALGGAAPEWMIVLSVCGLIASLLRNQRRVWIGIACVLGNALTIYCLNGSTQVVLPFATLVVGWLFFCLIPEEGMTWLRAALQVVDGDQTGIPAMGQQAMAHWVTDCARALQRMSNALPSQTPEALRPIQLTEQVANRLCDGCVRQTDCWDTHYAETLSMLSDMLEETLQSETSIREIAQRARTQGCQRADLLPPLLESTNRARQRRAKHAVRQAQARKLAIAQMHGQAGMLQTLAGTLGETVGCDAQEQTEIRRALWHTPWRDCTWLACRVDDMLQVSVQGAAQAPEQIEKLRILLSRALQSTLEYHLPEDEEDMDNLLFLERTALTVQVGIACEPVFGETQPGDSYLARKMANGLQFLAISDGMGNGLQAQRQSKTAISLLYNCLVAGYGRRDALETVNGLMLACQGEETYATMDLCLLDLETGEAVFDKLGACASYLLRQGKCRKLGGETLPVGILEAVSPRSFRIRMREEDLLLLCSDGIMEAFGLDDAIVIHALAGLNAEDPQGFAEAFMRRAMHAAGDKARDDMTVLVARVVPNAEVKAAQ